MAKRLKCPKCKRTFSMAAHLARHVSAIHGKKASKKLAKKKSRKGKRRVGRPKGVAKKVGRPKSRVAKRRKVAGRGAAQLRSRTQAYRRELLAKRGALDSQLKGVDRAIRALRGA